MRSGSIHDAGPFHFEYPLDRTLGLASLAVLPAKVTKVWRFVLEDTDLVVEATNELLGWKDHE